MWRTTRDPDALRASFIALREAVRQKALALEARYERKRRPLERARQEFLQLLEHLRQQGAEGRYPASLLKPALMREELRLKHLEAELSRLEDNFRKQVALLWTRARAKAARTMARAGINLDLDELFPEGKE